MERPAPCRDATVDVICFAGRGNPVPYVWFRESRWMRYAGGAFAAVAQARSQ